MQNRLYQQMLDSASRDDGKKPYSGELCPGAKKRLTKAIEFLVMSSRKKTIYNTDKKQFESFRLGFCTLTISETERLVLGDEGHEKLLEPFLQWARRKHGVKCYVWKAELQERKKYNKKRVKMGLEVVKQLHYHITWDAWISMYEVQNKWNELQRKAGLLDNFHKKYGRWNAPSTEIHKTKNIKNLASYLQKAIISSFSSADHTGLVGEMAKVVQNRESIGSKVWDCSLNLKGNAYYNTVMDMYRWDYLDSLVTKKEVRRIDLEQAVIYKFNKPLEKYLDDILTPGERVEFEAVMLDVRTRMTNIKLKPKEPVVTYSYSEMLREKPRIIMDIQNDLFNSN